MQRSHKERSKRHYDGKVRSSVLYPGDRVLVRNLTLRGGTGKLCSHWEENGHYVCVQGEHIVITNNVAAVDAVTFAADTIFLRHLTQIVLNAIKIWKSIRDIRTTIRDMFILR